jgi:hypothetical protein
MLIRNNIEVIKPNCTCSLVGIWYVLGITQIQGINNTIVEGCEHVVRRNSASQVTRLMLLEMLLPG